MQYNALSNYFILERFFLSSKILRVLFKLMQHKLPGKPL